jgi:hypothetical protein
MLNGQRFRRNALDQQLLGISKLLGNKLRLREVGTKNSFRILVASAYDASPIEKVRFLRNNLSLTDFMREVGIEPTQALSYCHLKAARLTAPALPHESISL